MGLLSPIQEDESIYPIPMTGFNISQKINLVNCNFDLIRGSNKSKEVNKHLSISYLDYNSVNLSSNNLN